MAWFAGGVHPGTPVPVGSSCEGAGVRIAVPPRGEDLLHQISVDACGGVHVEIVRAEGVEAVQLHVSTSLTDAPVTAAS